jgi:phospholipase A1
MRIIKSCILCFLCFTSAYAQNSETDDDIPPIRNGKDVELPSIAELIDYNISNNAKNGFSAHKQNYFLLYTYSNYQTDRQKKEIKFQISIKQRILRFYGWAFYFGYTQKSLWQAYDSIHSRPFRENNFNPELFFRTKMWNGLRFDFGIEHESNGQSGEKSRSWNRIFLTPYYEDERFVFFLKGWYRLPEDRKKSPEDTEGDDNPDIHKYMGYCEIGMTLKMPELLDIQIANSARFNVRTHRGAFLSSITIPFRLSSSSAMVQYFDGYGESLIDYNVKQRRIGFGFCFTR